MFALKSILLYAISLTILVGLTSGKPVINKKDFVKTANGILISKHEVTNEEYRQFLTWIRTNSPGQLPVYLYDSAAWTIKFKKSYNEPLRNLYHWHPAYNRYPVVNITQAAAEAYCRWLTNSYNSDPSRRYKKVLFRLPTEKEWLKNAGEELTAMGPASGLANIKWNDSTKGIDDYKIDGAIQTAPVMQYKPNSLGLFDMKGNASEIISSGSQEGGNWDSYAADCNTAQSYQLPDPRVGFRIVMEIEEE